MHGSSMKYSIHLLKLPVIFSVFIIGNATHATEVRLNYLTDFKVPMQKAYCMGKASNGDMVIYKKCMLAIDKDAYKCDKETKAIYDHEFINYTKEATEFMEDIKPLAKQYFNCLSTVY